MPSSTTLYTSPGNAGNVASRNFTTLYSGSGSINPTQPYGNANVVGLLAASTDGANTIGVISATGNIITDAFFIGNGSQLTGIVATSVNANALTGNTLSSNVLFSSLTTVGTLSNVSVSGTVTAGNLSAAGFVSATGNVTGNYIIGNGSLLTNINAANVIGAYGNANVAAYLPTFGGNILFGNLLMNPNSGNASIGPGTGNTAGMVLKNEGPGGLTNTVDINDLHVDLISIDPINGGNASLVVDGAFGVYFRTTNVANVQKNWDFTDTGDTFFPGPLRLANGTSLVNSVVYTNVDGTAGQVLTTYGNGITYFDTVSAYGNANVVSLLSNLGANSISTTGNVTAANFFGNVTGNIIGNVVVPGSNTEVLINNSGNLGTGPGFTFNTASNVLTVPGTVTATGNITGAYIAGNGSLLTNLTGANVTGTVANATFATSSGSATTAATVTGNAQANITSVGTLTSLSVTGNATTGNLLTGGVVSATGNVTGNYILGNGSQLTGLPATYGNADVVSLLAAFGSNSISTTGNVTASYVIGNGSLLSNITGANVTGTVANATFATSAGSATTAATVTGNAQANITSVGTLTSLSVSGNTTTGNLLTGGIVSAVGNVTGNYFIGNGSQLTGLPATYGNADVVSLLAAFGSNSISTTGNVTASYVIGNGSLLSNITGANVTGTVANATYATSSGSATTSGTVTGNAQANITSVGTLSSLSVSGNVDSGNILTAGIVSATGNVTGNYILGNGSQLTGITTSAGGSPFQFQYNNSGAFGGVPNTNYYSGNGTIEMALTQFEATGVSGIVTVPGTAGYVSVVGNVIAGNVFTGGVVSATGNVTGNYFIGNGSQLTGITASAGGSNTQIQFNNAGVFAGNAAMTFETVTGNVGLGNLIIGSGNTASVGAGQRINTIAAHTGTLGNATNFGNAQIVIGNGYFGNMNFTNTSYATGVRGGKVLLWDSANVSDAGNVGVRYSGMQVSQQMVFTSNIANVNNSSFNGTSGILAVGGGTSGNSFVSGSPAQLFGAGGFVFVGQPSTAIALGNTTLGMAAGVASRLQVYANSALTTAVVGNFGTGQNGNITNNLGLSVQFNNGSTGGFIPSRVYGLYMGGATATVGAVNNSNTARSSGEYYFLRNDDAVAQTQLGTLRSYNEFNSVSATTSGALTIDKAVSQVHQVNLAGNITSVTYANMVSSLSDSVNTDEEVDTVTIIFNQGATGGYSVALPTGATYKYAGGGNTVSTTANSVTLVAVTVVRISGTPTYLTTVSPGFT